MPDALNISQEVASALSRNQGVVALESSLIAHGLPANVNTTTAIEMEEAVRAANCIPATIGIIEGEVKIGLTKEEIERLGEGKAAKICARDIPYAIAKKLDGGTTVSATARIANAAGIVIMATGGIGGVHRGFAESLDISSDLWELARTPIIVVCSGVKAILDVAATAEWLESHSVPVYGFGTDELPAFYSRSSGIKVPKVESADELAEMLKTSGWAFGLRSAVLIAVPIPEEAELDITDKIEQAMSDADDKGVNGKDFTPYLLKKVDELTGGKSVKSNAVLLKNNAKVAGEIARAISEATSNRRIGFLV